METVRSFSDRVGHLQRSFGEGVGFVAFQSLQMALELHANGTVSLPPKAANDIIEYAAKAAPTSRRMRA